MGRAAKVTTNKGNDMGKMRIMVKVLWRYEQVSVAVSSNRIISIIALGVAIYAAVKS